MRNAEKFAYPDQRSTFETLLHGDWQGEMPVRVERVRTSPGYNTSPLPRHVIGLHLGAPTPIAHWRDQPAKLHRFRPGDVIFTTAGSPVHYAHPEPVDALYIALDPALVGETAGQMGLLSEQVILRDNFGAADPTIDAIGRAFLKELNSPGIGGTLYVEGLTIQLIVHLLRRYGPDAGVLNGHNAVEANETRTRLRTAVDYIQDHFSDDLSLAEIAAVVHLTPYHFGRLFKSVYGVSPYQYVIQQRVAAAADLLQNPRLTVAEIAAIVGFADHSHLIRHYKRLTGRTPRA